MSADPLSANLRGALWMLASVVGATGMTIFVRQLTPEMHTAMIAFLRSVLGLAFVAPMLLARTPPALTRLRRPGLHLLRGALIAVAVNLGFYAIWRLPVATATILFFLAPVFSTMLAPFMVGEKVGPRRWAAVAVGFLGALIVVRPGAAPVGVGALAAVGSSLCFALALLLGKTASRADGSNAVFASSAILAAVLTLPFAVLEWSAPSGGWVWATLGALTAASSLRGYADIRAMNAGEASFVAPVSYLRLPTVALAGWLLFGESVDVWTWVGGGVIAAATLFIALRERAARPSAPPASPG
jgi:drug/metabolite transporter (DMT)-like permease